MQKITKEWRKATPEEITQGSDEMILVREFSVDIEPENKEVELWRIKGVLTLMGRVDEVDVAIEKLPEPNRTLARFVWNTGNVLNSESETVKFVQSSLGLTDEEKDSIFEQAAAIKL
jgi:hypothetical protein